MTATMQDSDEFWRSGAGADAYAALLERHFSQLQGRHAFDLVEAVGFDVLVLQGFPDAEFVTAITRGLSAFILPQASGRSPVRQELAWTLPLGASQPGMAAVLQGLGHRLLDRRRALAQSEILADVDFAPLGQPGPSVRHMLVMLDHWLERGQARIDNHFPGFVVELVAVTDAEARLIETDREAFYRLCRADLIDTMDLRRPAQLPRPPSNGSPV